MSKKNIIVVIICICILGMAAGILYFIFTTEPEAQSEGATKRTAMLVDVEMAESGQFVPEFLATGTVLPVKDLQLSPMISGQIAYMSANFVPGGIVRKGQEMFKINEADFVNQVKLRESELAQVKTNLAIEMGRQNIARQDLALVGSESLSSQEQSLVLREPQLEAIKAQIVLAELNLSQAELSLSRTTVTAPFDAQIITQNVTEGSQVSPSINVGRLIGIAEYWIQASVPIEKLKWLNFPSNINGKGSEVRIRNIGSWGEEEFRTGNIFRQLGTLEQQTRLARILIKVTDPLATYSSNKGKQKLIIGEFVEVLLKGKETEPVVKLNRDYLRSNNTVWVMEDGELDIRTVSIELIDKEFAYVSNGLQGGDMIVTTNLSTVSAGVPLRTESDTSNKMVDKYRDEK